MGDDGQQDDAPVPDDAEDQTGSADGSQAEGTKEEGLEDEQDAPQNYLDPRYAQQITNVWKIEHQHIGHQQTGAVFGGQSRAAGTASVGTERTGRDLAGPVRGKVRAADLQRIRAVHVCIDPTYQQAHESLEEHRLVILHGRARWGKATTALYLLDQRHRDEVYLLEETVTLRTLEGAGLEDGKGYLIECLAVEEASALSPATLMHLSEWLAKSGSHLVVTVDGLVPMRTHALRWALVTCDEVPDARDVLDRNLAWRLRDAAYDGEELARPQWIQDELDACPHPARVDMLASVLERVTRGDLEAGYAYATYRDLLSDQVAEWFETHPGLRERCLMVAIAVFNNASYQEVADAADRLEKLLEPPEDDEDEDGDKDTEPEGPGWDMASSRRRRVQDCCADLFQEYEPTEIGNLPVELVRLEDPHLQRAVLEHVWTEHDVVRMALLDWFKELGASPSRGLRGRVAAAVGSLAQRDFLYFHNQLIHPWASDENKNMRQSAAVALDVLAAPDDDSEQRVRALLRRWISWDAESPAAWTAIAAYAYEFGRRDPDAALKDLLTVILQGPSALWIAGQMIASLCDFGFAHLALERLTYWSGHLRGPSLRDRPLRERSLQVFLHAVAKMAVSTPELPWPGQVLLRVAGEQADLRAQIVTLWQRALEHDRLGKDAGKKLRAWFSRADAKAELVPALDDLVADLFGLPARTRTILERLLKDWRDDPLRPSAAAARYLPSVPTARVKP